MRNRAIATSYTELIALVTPSRRIRAQIGNHGLWMSVGVEAVYHRVVVAYRCQVAIRLDPVAVHALVRCKRMSEVYITEVGELTSLRPGLTVASFPR